MERLFFYAMLAVYDAHRKFNRRLIQKYNLSDGYPKVLLNLRRTPGCLQKELAAACKVEPATMTVLLRGMLKKGLVRKEETYVSGGKRALRIFLTEEGEKLANISEETLKETNECALKGFTDEEVTLLTDMLNRVKDNLKNA